MAEESPLHPAAASDANILRMPISASQWDLLIHTQVKSFRWSTRATSAFKYAQCRNLAEVFSIPKDDWAERRQVGKKTALEIANRIKAFLKIKRLRPVHPPCDTTAIEQNIKLNKISAALAEALALGALAPVQKRVLQLRFGLSGRPPKLQVECARIMHSSRQSIFQAEKLGIGHLSGNPDILRAARIGLQDIQARLWQKMAGKTKTWIPKGHDVRELYKRAGGPESLLIRVYYGDIRKWLNKNLTATRTGWRIPV